MEVITIVIIHEQGDGGHLRKGEHGVRSCRVLPWLSVPAI